MDQHKLYRTIKLLGSEKHGGEESTLGHVLENIIANEEIPIRGGRIWKLELSSGSYRLVRQYGDMEPIKRNFRIRVSDYPLFLQLARKGALIGRETNKYLRQKGILRYSAAGVGEKLPWKEHLLYQYVLAINAEYLKDDTLYALNIIGNALTATLRSRKIETAAKQLKADLDKAREIQQSILPAHELRFHDYDLYGISLPDRVVGGDFFDYLQTSEDKDRLGVVIGDAASKGLSAAAQALYVSGALRMGVEYQTKLNTFIGRINKLVNKTFTTEHFISMVYAELTNASSGLVFYVNAGHSNPILLRSRTDQAEFLKATGQILGPFPHERYNAEFTLMNRGDLLLLYTDGIVEATNEKKEMYGEQRLVHQLRSLKAKMPREICMQILEDLQVFSRISEYSDDKTLVVIKRTR